MQLEKGIIPGSQLNLLMIGFIWGSIVILAPVEGISKHDGWISLLAGIAIGLIFILIYSTLAQQFQGKTLVQMNDLIYGPYVGKLISILYSLYFLQLTAFNLRDYGDFIYKTILPKTPLAFTLTIILFVCATAVRKGIETIGRTCFLIIVTSSIIFILLVVLSVPDMDFSNFLPVASFSTKDFIQSVHAIDTIPFGEPIVFLMFTAYVNDSKEIKKSMLIGAATAGLVLLIVFLRDISILGDLSSIEIYPTFQAVRLINIGETFTRLEVFYSVVILFVRFIKLSILFYATVLAIAQILKLSSYLPLVFPIGIIIVILGLIQFEFTQESFEFAVVVGPFYTFPFVHLIPIVSLTITKIRKLPESTKGGAK